MSGLLAWLLVVSALGVVLVRRRSVAVVLVSAQALALAGLGAWRAHDASDLVAAGALLARAAALCALLLLVVTRSREARPVRAAIPPTTRAAAAVVATVAAVWLVPPLGFTSHWAEPAVLALVACGLVCGATRRATLFQVLGIVLVENGVALAALQVPHGSPLVVELGAAFDLALVAVVATVLHLRIYEQVGAGDSAALRSLRDT